VVHSVGGWGALATLMIIGPRLGRFDADHLVSAFHPSSMPLAAIGTIFLFIGWLGFNGGSTLGWNEQVGPILVNTLLAGTAGAVSAGVLAFGVTNRLDAGQFMNGCLGGLVAITAGVNLFSSPLAILIGFVGGMVVVAAEEILDFLKIDDAVGAIPVHLGAGIWGTLAVGLYGDLELLGTGLSRFEQIGVQILGIAVYAAWAFGISLVVLMLVNQVYRLRVTSADEEMGLNLSEHGIMQE
jgi:Amt family ammonium transporter